MNVFMGRKDISHYHKINLADIGHSDAMKSVKACEQGVGVPFYVVKVLAQDFSEKFMLRLPDSLDNVSEVLGKIKKRAAFPWRAYFGESILPCQ